jgi:hypothetical protein
MTKPEKKWVVGERQFNDYREAKAFASENNLINTRDELIAVIENFIEIDWRNEEWNPGAAADELLSQFIIRRKQK